MKIEAEKKRGKASKLKSSNELQSTNILGSEFKNNFNDAQRQIKETIQPLFLFICTLLIQSLLVCSKGPCWC